MRQIEWDVCGGQERRWMSEQRKDAVFPDSYTSTVIQNVVPVSGRRQYAAIGHQHADISRGIERAADDRVLHSAFAEDSEHLRHRNRVDGPRVCEWSVISRFEKKCLNGQPQIVGDKF